MTRRGKYQIISIAVLATAALITYHSYRFFSDPYKLAGWLIICCLLLNGLIKKEYPYKNVFGAAFVLVLIFGLIIGIPVSLIALFFGDSPYIGVSLGGYISLGIVCFVYTILVISAILGLVIGDHVKDWKFNLPSIGFSNRSRQSGLSPNELGKQLWLDEREEQRWKHNRDTHDY